VLNGGRVTHDGDPSEGIRILRDGYEADRKLTAELDRNGERRTPDYEILDVDVATTSIGDQVDIVVTLAVEIHKQTTDWGVGFSIDNTLGLRLYNMTTFGLDSALPNTLGRHEVTFTLRDVRLGFGKYLVNIGLGNAEGLNFDLRMSAASFDMPGEDLGHGLLRISPQVSAI
jgi:ABC-2 type transport system ATP-binding protein